MTDLVALVTGASGGIGRATCRRLAREGRAVAADVSRADAVDAFDHVLGVNRRGSFLAARFSLPHLPQAGGATGTIASTAGLRGHGFGAGICPGFTDTPLTGGVQHDPQFAKRITRGVPMGRIGQPEEVAAMACHLLGAGASDVNGRVIAVDGGATAM